MTPRPSTNCQPTSETLPEQPLETVDAICAEHGPYQARVLTLFSGSKPITTRCPICTADARAAEDARAEREKTAARECRVAEVAYRSNIPARFAGRGFADYRATEPGQRMALGACRAFVDAWPDRLTDGASLVLTGGPGTGKTHLACAVGMALIHKHLASVKFGTVSTVLRFIKDTYRKDSERSEQDAIDALTAPDLLILDEVGVQVGSEHEKMLMFEVLNARYQECRPTILISNLSAADLEDFLGQRIMDRYRECGAVLAFNWQSHRGRVESPRHDGRAAAAGGDS